MRLCNAVLYVVLSCGKLSEVAIGSRPEPKAVSGILVR